MMVTVKILSRTLAPSARARAPSLSQTDVSTERKARALSCDSEFCVKAYRLRLHGAL